MKYLSHQITFQEIPDEVSLSFLITGCTLRCKGCHSSDSWDLNRGQNLDETVLIQLIAKYHGALTCVLFLGGEWHSNELVQLLRFCRGKNLKTALYTGQEDIAIEIKNELTYLKTGSWQKNLGGLDSPKTNQKLTNLTTGQIMNTYFTAQGGQYGQTDREPNQRQNQLYTALSSES